MSASESSSALRGDAVVSLRQALEAMRQAREQIRGMEAGYRRAIKDIESGINIDGTLENMHAAETRGGLNDRLHELEQSRHRARLAIFAAGLHEGMTIGAVGRRMGFSRQLASRIAKESRSHQ